MSDDTSNLRYEISFGLQIISADTNATMYLVMEAFRQQAVSKIVNHQSLYFDIIDVSSFSIESIKQCNATIDVVETGLVSRQNETQPFLTLDQSEISTTNHNSFEYISRVSLYVEKTRNRTALELLLLQSRNTMYNLSVESGFVILKSFPYNSFSECINQQQEKSLCYISVNNNDNQSQESAITVRVNKLLSCSLSQMENYTESIMAEICLKHIPFERVTNSSTLKLCNNDLPLLSMKPVATTMEPLQLANGIFSFICTVCSLVCLAFTFLTYMLFKSIRTIPGINNINLVFNLFWAQALTQFGVLQTSHPVACFALSIFTHYFWLGSFCSMNICSFHMFKVFTSPLYSQMGRSKAIILKYCLYIYLAPAITISIYILIKWLLDGSENLGYGGDVCFLSETVSIVIMFVIPASLIIILNAIFSGLAYWHIRSSPRVQSNKSRRNDFKIYVKLLTVTGIAWPLIFIDILLPLSPLSFVSTFANAFQGVFIFAAFICNKKVGSMYKMSCCKTQWIISKGSENQSTNLRTISHEQNGTIKHIWITLLHLCEMYTPKPSL